jgi:uncharacterized membrane protein
MQGWNIRFSALLIPCGCFSHSCILLVTGERILMKLHASHSVILFPVLMVVSELVPTTGKVAAMQQGAHTNEIFKGINTRAMGASTVSLLLNAKFSFES